MPYLIGWEDHLRAIKVIKVLLAICVFVSASTAKGNLMTQINRFLLVRHWEHHWYRWLVDPKDFKWNRNKIENIQERCFLTGLNGYSSNYLELVQSYRSISMETQKLRALNNF